MSQDTLVEDGFRHLEKRNNGDLTWNYLPITLPTELCKLESAFRCILLPIVCPEWDPSALDYRIFEEGVSNVLIGFFQTGRIATDNVVMVRLHVKGRELIVDSRMEIAILLTLHRAGISPPLYLEADNAICYGFIPGRTLTKDEMQRDVILKATAQTMAQLHSISVPVPLQCTKPMVWAKIDKWMDLILRDFPNSLMNGTAHELGTTEELKRELNWLKAHLGAPNHLINRGSSGDSRQSDVEQHQHRERERGGRRLPCDSPTVLCHNDAHPLNFILSPNGKLTLIDFEYSGMNYPAFDIGCFFCEFAGVHGKIDYDKYPSESVQKTWITYYLEERSKLKGEDPERVTSEQVHGLYTDANKFALAAHFMWTLWSLIQSKHSPISFNYLQYGTIRYKEYKKRKSISL